MMPQIDFSTYGSQAFWLAITFSLTFLTVKFLIVPSMNSIIEFRNDSISSNISIAKRNLALIKSISLEIEEMRSEAKQREDEVMNKEKILAKAVYDAEIESFKKKINEMNKNDIDVISNKIDNLKQELMQNSNEILSSILVACGVSDIDAKNASINVNVF